MAASKKKSSSKRAFSPDGLTTKKVDNHGGARYTRTNPDIAAKGIKSVNVFMTFEEAMKLSLAVQACLLSLNRYNRATTKGKNMGLCLTVFTDNQAVNVIEAPATAKAPKK